MARGDGVNRTSARNVNLTAKSIVNAQRHNEREKESYVNQDIVPERTQYNIHFKTPTGSYAEMFDQMIADGTITTRGLKEDANLYGELIFDVNSAYFFNHGGYDFAKQFYEDAYKAAIQIVGGEQYILSAVMHADERNRAMSEALGRDVFHYHLHVVYVPVVEKQILWTKRCKDPALVGTVKETIMQVSSSKKWISKPALNADGNPLMQKNGKPVLKKSYSVLQDDFFNAMKRAGYGDVERGEHGSSEEHLTVTQFKVEREQERLDKIEQRIEKKEAELADTRKKIQSARADVLSDAEIDSMGRQTITGKVQFSKPEASHLKALAKEAISSKSTIYQLKNDLEKARQDAHVWRSRYEKIKAQFDALKEQVKGYLAALERAPERVMAFIDRVLRAAPEQIEPEKNRAVEQPQKHKNLLWKQDIR